MGWSLITIMGGRMGQSANIRKFYWYNQWTISCVFLLQTLTFISYSWQHNFNFHLCYFVIILQETENCGLILPFPPRLPWLHCWVFKKTQTQVSLNVRDYQRWKTYCRARNSLFFFYRFSPIKQTIWHLDTLDGSLMAIIEKWETKLQTATLKKI